MSAPRDRPPRESWGRHIYRPYLRPVDGNGRRKRPIATISITMIAAAICLGVALALLRSSVQVTRSSVGLIVGTVSNTSSPERMCGEPPERTPESPERFTRAATRPGGAPEHADRWSRLLYTGLRSDESGSKGNMSAALQPIPSQPLHRPMSAESTAVLLRLPPDLHLTDDQFYAFCLAQPGAPHRTHPLREDS